MILRGNKRTEIFCADADYKFYLEKLQLACDTQACDIHAYAQYHNYCYQGSGTLWEGVTQ